MLPSEHKQSKILITGISGFLASRIAAQLLEKGYTIRGTVRHMTSATQITDRLCRQSPDNRSRLEIRQADLCNDDGWTETLDGCDYVLHIASPFPAGLPTHENDLILPAKDGTLRVLQAAHKTKIKRVVLTSSIAATNHGNGTAPFTEADWTDPYGTRATPYYKAKTLAEQAAWAYADANNLDLTVINPGMIFGPLQSPNIGASVGLLRQLMNGKFSRLPRFGFPVVDVRDVADVHIKAMFNPAASGQRFIVAGQFLWLKDISNILAKAFPDYAHRLPTKEIPNWLVRVMASVSPMSRMIVHELGRDLSVDTSKARHVLDWKSRSESETICDCVQSLLDLNLINTPNKA